MTTIHHRLHVIPPLRRIGALILPAWLAITIGRDIVSWRPLDAHELEHELEHVRQWNYYGVLYIPRYVRASWRAWRAGGDRYRDNAFEVAARRAADRVWIRADRSGPGGPTTLGGRTESGGQGSATSGPAS